MTPDELEAAIKRRSAVIDRIRKLDKLLLDMAAQGAGTPEERALYHAARQRFEDKYGKGPA